VTDLFREAEDELRRETVESVAKRSVPFVIGAVVLALVAGGGFTAWQHFDQKALAEGNAALAAATAKLNANDLDGGIADLEPLTKSGPRKVRDHALLLRASAISVKGDPAAALAAFDTAVSSIANRDLADMARLRAAYIAADTETREQVAARLKPLVDGEGPLAPLARELNAAMAWAAGDSAAARAEYDLMQLDPNVPEGLRQRAGQAVAVIDAGATASTDLMRIAPPPGAPGGPGAPAAGGGAASGAPQAGTPAAGPAAAQAAAQAQAQAAAQARQQQGAAAPNRSGGVVNEDFLAEVERERAAEEARQRETTREQQRAVDAEVQRRVEEARRAQEAASQPAPAPPPPPAPAGADETAKGGNR
jgi:hypothetical protein